MGYLACDYAPIIQHLPHPMMPTDMESIFFNWFGDGRLPHWYFLSCDLIICSEDVGLQFSEGPVGRGWEKDVEAGSPFNMESDGFLVGFFHCWQWYYDYWLIAWQIKYSNYEW